MTEKAEQFLLDRGFTQVRVRSHGTVARIELLPSEFDKFFEGGFAAETDEYLKSLGYDYVSLDLGGYKTGNMNKGIDN